MEQFIKLTEEQQNEIVRQVKKGFICGTLEGPDGERIDWNFKIEINRIKK
jgi:hypothetical protein